MKITRKQIREYAQRNGRKGGKARAAKMTEAQLSASGKHAAVARWSKRTVQP